MACVLVLALAACQDQLTAPRPGTVRADLQDGAHGVNGNPHFFFLRPLLQPPTAFPGTFDPTQSPTVEICEWSGTACAGSATASFGMSPGGGSDAVRVEPGSEQYLVDWHTSEDALDVTKTYRIRVLVGTHELGHVDVDLVDKGSQLKNVNTGEYIGLVNGRTLPIKFRIERGAVPATEVQPLAAGNSHTCALSSSGAAYCWGSNMFGELGTGITGLESGERYIATPQPVLGGLTFQAVSAGAYFTCGLTASGAAYCWGQNDVGELGTGSVSGPKSSPEAVVGGHVFRAITSGVFHTCGLDTQGTAYCWGYNNFGQLGAGSTAAPSAVAVPTAVPGLSFLNLSAGAYHTCGVATDGITYCWGDNEYGQLGNGRAGYDGSGSDVNLTPQRVSGTTSFVRASAGSLATCALTVDDTAFCWGYNERGGLGRGTFSFVDPIPQPVIGSLSFAHLTLGAHYTCGLTSAGTAYCWGYNVFGQLGNGSRVTTATPTPIPGLTFSSLEAGWLHACGVLSDGSARCWGWNDDGQVGNGSTSAAVMSPSTVVGGVTFLAP